MIRPRIQVFLLLLIAHSGSAVADFNYAYSVFVGTGAYRIEDQTIYVLRVPLRWDLRGPDHEEGKIGYRLLMPFSVGVTNFDSIDELPGLEFESLQTMSVTPGVELQIPVLKRTLVKPFIQAGLSWDMKTSANSRIMGAGSRFRTTYGYDDQWILGGEFLYARNNPNKDNPTTSFARWGFGGEYKYTTNWYPFGHRVSWHARMLLYHFSNPTNFENEKEIFNFDNAAEVGVSFGINPPIYIFGYAFRQGGIGYEQSDEFKAIKLFTTFPF